MDLFKYFRHSSFILSGIVICAILTMSCKNSDNRQSASKASPSPVLLDFPSWAQKSSIVHLNASNLLEVEDWGSRLAGLRELGVNLLYISSSTDHEIPELLSEGGSHLGAILKRIEQLDVNVIIDWPMTGNSGDRINSTIIDDLVAIISQYDVDGFMFSGTTNIEASTWNDIHKTLAGMGRPMLLLGSENEPMLRNKGYLHGDQGMEFYQIISGISNGSQTPYNLEPYLVLDQDRYTQGFHILYSVDVNSRNGISTRPLDKALKVMAMSFQGMTMIDGARLWSLQSKAGKTEERDGGSTDFRFDSELLKLKKENKSLWNDPYIVNTTLVDMGKRFIHYKRETAGNRVDFIINVTDATLSYTPSAEYKGLDYFSGETLHFYPAKSLEISPFGFKIVIKQ